MLRAAGLDISRTTTLMDMPTLIGPGPVRDRLRVGDYGFINAGCVFDLGAPITIESNVYIGHRVMVITSAHEVGASRQRAGAVTTSPVRVGQGSWLGAGCTILPGVTIGPGSIVAAGAVVTRDVDPDSLVAGVPARHVRSLPAQHD